MRLRPLVPVALLPLALTLGAARAHDDPAGLCRTAPSLEGTVWVGEDVCGAQTFRFEPDGVFAYTYRRNGDGPWQTFRNGTWRQVGSRLYFETNGKYAEREGRVQGDRISGRGWNVQGRTWRWSAVRQR